MTVDHASQVVKPRQGVGERAPWLPALFEADFSASKSETSPAWRPLFCIQCKGKAFGLKEKDEHHNGHPILHVQFLTRRPHIDLKDGGMLGIDVSQLHQYSINQASSAFRIMSAITDTSSSTNMIRREADHRFKPCKACGFLMEYKTYQGQSTFCSIKCLLSSTPELNDQADNLDHELPARKRPNGEEAPPSTQPGISFRKRPRKGIPIRAPLF